MIAMHAVPVKKDSGTVVRHVPREMFLFRVGGGWWLAIIEEIEMYNHTPKLECIVDGPSSHALNAPCQGGGRKPDSLAEIKGWGCITG